MTRPAPLFALLFCALSLGLSVMVFAREYRVVYHLQGTVDDRIDSLVGPGPLPRAASARSTRDLLSSCARLMTRTPRLRAEPAMADAVRTACGRIAGAILDTAPGHARARTVALLARLPGLEARDLALAQAAAPHDPWSLALRLDAFAQSAPGVADIADLAQGDITRALLSHWGRERVAALYAGRPDLRATIRTAAQSAPAPSQRAFLRLLRATVAETGG